MEIRKQKEIEYYDQRAKESLKELAEKRPEGDFEGFRADLLASFRFCYQWMRKNCPGKKVLDYGCGNGIHSFFLAEIGAEVVGIDLSEPSLELAGEKAQRKGVTERVKFLKMDCEKMDFPDHSFDVIFDGGTFSSLDIKRALPELARILKPAGFLIGIETLGHNPLTNLKRKINKIRGKRTGWAATHIFKMNDLSEAKNYFSAIETNFFHLTSLVIFPFLGLPGTKFLLKILEEIDRGLFKIPFFKKYAFKVVFIFSQPKI